MECRTKNGDICCCKYGPYPFVTGANDVHKYVWVSCPSIQLVRTKEANYYVCPKSGMPPDPIGWYPGRGW